MPAPVSKPFKICVVGGGIAGLAAASFLRADNREITILEQSRMNKEVGAAISLQPNATGVLERAGFAKYFDKYGAMVDTGFQIFRTDGVKQMAIPFNKENSNGYTRVLFHRVDLHDMLKELATEEDKTRGPAATIKTASRVASCDCEKGTITLESGEVLGEFDLIVGADGIHSKVRESVLGEKIQPKPTGLSAYRLLVNRDDIKDIPHAYAQCTQETWTSMMVGESCRAVMGPCRGGELLAIVALVPDDRMHEESTDSWTSSGSIDHLLESYAHFPEWIKTVFSRCPNLGLWQLRDTDPLSTWIKGRTILIGDAAHSMLPTQGQGASQSMEDAEALGTFFKDFKSTPSQEEISKVLKRVFDVRYERASIIQGYSRQQGRPEGGAVDTKTLEVKLNPQQFHHYNAYYDGAEAWEKKQQEEKSKAKSDDLAEKVEKLAVA
ncbi:hypothetical protein OIV83_001142 [Microbotryomycetes sp. JL201]|nr:hypothetical protein OIV83_001142 [Microbotryomycetes sp. JL201]